MRIDILKVLPLARMDDMDYMSVIDIFEMMPEGLGGERLSRVSRDCSAIVGELAAPSKDKIVFKGDAHDGAKVFRGGLALRDGVGRSSGPCR